MNVSNTWHSLYYLAKEGTPKIGFLSPILKISAVMQMFQLNFKVFVYKDIISLRDLAGVQRISC